MELAKVKRVDFLYRIFFLKEAFLTFVIYLNVSCIEHTFRIYILLHIKKKKKITSYKSPKALSVYLKADNE